MFNKSLKDKIDSQNRDIEYLRSRLEQKSSELWTVRLEHNALVRHLNLEYVEETVYGEHKTFFRAREVK